MEECRLPRLMIAGTQSGCGKTTVTCALLSALKAKGEQIAAFKCGPDYIDPMFHTRVVGAVSYTHLALSSTPPIPTPGR